jgi:histidine ammonia-lyase
MGYYVTDTCDILKMNIAQASTWLHAILANMVHPRKNHKLPTNLVLNPESQSGFRPLQLLACSLTVQNRKLAQCQQSYTLPTEGDNQDVKSLGTHAAYDFQESVDNLEQLTVILLLASTQALEFRGTEKAGIQSRRIRALIRQYSSTLTYCWPMSDEITKLVDVLQKDIL